MCAMTSKNRPISSLLTTLLVLTPVLAPALAWSATAASSNSASAVSRESTLFGTRAGLDTVTRTIDVAPGMKRVTVASGESVAFRAGGQTIGWTFLQSINGSAMNLAVLMPGVPQARDVYVFIEPSEIYSAG
jgi:hypothetical protein